MEDFMTESPIDNIIGCDISKTGERYQNCKLTIAKEYKMVRHGEEVGDAIGYEYKDLGNFSAIVVSPSQGVWNEGKRMRIYLRKNLICGEISFEGRRLHCGTRAWLKKERKFFGV